MALDLEKLKAKLGELNKPRSFDNLWIPQPAPEPYYIRIIPLQDSDESFAYERWFYRGFGKPNAIAPHMYGKPDPVQELISKLNVELGKNAWEVIKDIKAKPRYFVPIIVRNEDPVKVRFWSLNVVDYKTLGGFFFDQDYGVLNDVPAGHDIRVLVTQEAGRRYPKVDFTPRPKASPLGYDLKTLHGSMPNINDMYKMPSYDELKARVDTWVQSGNESGTVYGTNDRGGAQAQQKQRDTNGSQQQQTTQASRKLSIEDELDDAFSSIGKSRES